jgi:hypothetical protein
MHRQYAACLQHYLEAMFCAASSSLLVAMWARNRSWAGCQQQKRSLAQAGPQCNCSHKCKNVCCEKHLHGPCWVATPPIRAAAAVRTSLRRLLSWPGKLHLCVANRFCLLALNLAPSTIFSA